MSRDVFLIVIAMLSAGIGEGIFYSFQPIYLGQLGADPLRIGMIFSGVGLMMSISPIPAGYLADHFGRKPLLVLAWILGTAAIWIMALAESLQLFIMGMLLYGMTNFVSSPLNSYITAARGKWSIGRAFTFVSASFNVG